MIRPAKALPVGQTRSVQAPAVPEPSHPVAADTAFAADKSYRVRLNGTAQYLGSDLSPMHLHVVTGTVAQALRAKIARFDPV